MTCFEYATNADESCAISVQVSLVSLIEPFYTASKPIPSFKK
jgi:hypothetical protein